MFCDCWIFKLSHGFLALTEDIEKKSPRTNSQPSGSRRKFLWGSRNSPILHNKKIIKKNFGKTQKMYALKSTFENSTKILWRTGNPKKTPVDQRSSTKFNLREIIHLLSSRWPNKSIFFSLLIIKKKMAVEKK
jgi:hypothetical protein